MHLGCPQYAEGNFTTSDFRLPEKLLDPPPPAKVDVFPAVGRELVEQCNVVRFPTVNRFGRP